MAVTAPEPALLVASILGRDLAAVDRAVARCAEQLGTRLLFASEPLEFTFTDYYRDELGPSPVRRLVAFELLGDASQLADLKRTTCRLEVALSSPGGGRAVNIDPGFLDADQLVLASTKRRAHRIHLGRGVYADLMLVWRPDGFAPLPWTYPDYAGPDLRALCERLRDLLLELRRTRKESA